MLDFSPLINSDGNIIFYEIIKGEEIMIKNIVFDLGNVLLDFKPGQFLSEKYPGDTGLQKRLYREIFQSEEWIMLDKGILDQDEVVERFSDKYPADADKIDNIFQRWTEMLKPISGTVTVLKKLRDQNYKLYALSNFHIKAFKKVFNDNVFFQYFNGIVISAEEKIIKPEKAIYQKLISRYQIIPEESIFIDDTEENLEGADKFGFKTILFRSPLELIQKLKDAEIEL